MPRKLLEGNRLVPDLEADPRGRRAKVVTKGGKAYAPSPLRVALFKAPTGDWLDAEDWPSHPCVLVCRTPGCPAEGEEVPSSVGENVDGVFRAACGGCGNAITEILVEDTVVPLPLEPGKPNVIK